MDTEWCMDTCFIIHVKTEDMYKYIAKKFEERFGSWNFELER